jgi:hypothetical protein
MRRKLRRVPVYLPVFPAPPAVVSAGASCCWRREAVCGAESRAQEITAYLRPNPDITGTIDQINPFTPNPYQPFANALPFASASYWHERQHKRELRRESAQKATDIALSTQAALERALLLNLRNACEVIQ